MRTLLGATLLFACASIALPAVALAADAGAPADEITTLEKNLADEASALSTSDCGVACRALSSIRRAADRICALDPGARCSAARAKADEATRRVHEACPDCAIAALPSPAPKPSEPAMTKDGAKTEAQAAPPPSESKRGGCAGCAASGASTNDVGALVALGLGLVLAARRRFAARRG